MKKHKHKYRIGSVLLIPLILICVSLDGLYAQSSPNYTMTKSVIDMSGAVSQSESYNLLDATGQPSPIGDISSINYFLSPGFLGRAPLNPIHEIKLIGSDTDSADTFGRAAAIFGEYALIGSAYNDNENGPNAGAAYVFKRDGETWNEEQKLLASDGDIDDIFGNAVDIDGDYMIIGAPWNDDDATESGSAYIFRKDGDTWLEETKLTASDAGEDNRFGISVAISGDYVVVGAFFDDDFGTRSGSAYIYKRNGTEWTEQAILTASDGATNDWFGVTVSIQGEYAIIGSRYDDNDNGSNAGAAYIFKRNNTTWTELQKLTASDGADNDLFHKTSIYGDYIAIGAYQDDDMGNNSGSIYIFKPDGAGWSEQEKITASDGEAGTLFGTSIAMSDKRIVVSSYKDNDNGNNSGSVYVFKHDGTNWNEEHKITARSGDAGDYFGLPVDIDQNYVLVGSRNDDDMGNNSGAAYIYKLDKIITSINYELSQEFSTPTTFSLSQAYPNPFNPETTIEYQLPHLSQVTLTIHNILGKEINCLVQETKSAGHYSLLWNGRDKAGHQVSSGIYFYRIEIQSEMQSFTDVKKMILMK